MGNRVLTINEDGLAWLAAGGEYDGSLLTDVAEADPEYLQGLLDSGKAAHVRDVNLIRSSLTGAADE